MHRFSAIAFVPLVAAHGFIRSPAPRQPGDAFKAACGEQPFFQQSADINGNVQGILQVVGSNFDAAACNLWLCKGFQFDDNKANVQSFSLGQSIDFDINIAAPHTGVANVSVVKTSTNSIIGTPLIEFENYAANSGVAANNSAFSVTLPESLDGECTTAGDCVLQWYWDAPDIDQTYESCVDFTVAGSGQPGQPPRPSSSAPAPSSAPSGTPAPAPPSGTPAPAPPTPTAIVTTSIVPSPSDAPQPQPTQPGQGDECDGEEDEEDEDEEGEEDDECDAEGEDEEDEEDEEDDECDAEGDEEEDEDEEDECDAEGEEDEDEDEEQDQEPVPTLTNKEVEPTKVPQPNKPQPNKPQSNKPQPTTLRTIVREVTVTAPAATVTVTAPAAAECTTA